jgi:phosphoglycolate phosphatase
MRFKAFIFDFDGTLVESNKIKRDAFYSLSEKIKRNPEAVDHALSSIPESSRFEIIAKIHQLINEPSALDLNREEEIKQAVETYSQIVRDGVLACPEISGATSLLSSLKARDRLIFISSNTPEEFLGELIASRKWSNLINGYYGYPKKKVETIFSILQGNQLKASETVVIGDGDSDEISARKAGCTFYKITSSKSLVDLNSLLFNSNSHV